MLEWLQQDPWSFLQFMLYRAPAVLLALTLHELAHGYVALRCGDTTARDHGRLTLNPAKHLDPIGTISMFLMGVGWAKPVPVNPANYRNGRWDDLKVSLAGVTTNFLLFLICTILSILLSRAMYKPEYLKEYGAEFFLSFQGDGFWMQLLPNYQSMIAPALRAPGLLHVQRFLFQLAFVNLGMGLFNLLPLPPLDGFHVVNDLIFRGRIKLSGAAFRLTHLVLMVLLMSTDFIGKWVSRALYAIQDGLLSALLGIFPVL